MDWDSFCLRIMGPLCGMGDRSKFDPLTHADCAILVDLTGKRFVAEPLAPRIDPFDTGHVIIRRPKGKSFFLYSANTLKKIIADTQRNEDHGDHVFRYAALPPYEEIDGWFEEAIAKGRQVRGGQGGHRRGAGGADRSGSRCAEGDRGALQRRLRRRGRIGTAWAIPQPVVPLRTALRQSGKPGTDESLGGARRRVNAEMQAYRADGGLGGRPVRHR